MPALYRARHRRAMPTDNRPFHEGPAPDPQYSEATCSGMGSFPDPGHMSCPRHHPDTYAEMFARHATDSFGPALHASPVYGCDCSDCREVRYHGSDEWGR